LAAGVGDAPTRRPGRGGKGSDTTGWSHMLVVAPVAKRGAEEEFGGAGTKTEAWLTF